MAARKKKDKKRKQKKRRQPGKPKLTPKLTQGLPENTEVISTPGGQEKMSEVLLEFVEPYLQYGRTEEALNKLLTVALINYQLTMTPSGPNLQVLSTFPMA